MLGHTLYMGDRSSNSETNRIQSLETPVFADKDYDFRIPALLYVREWSTFLAFAEKRTTLNDEHATNLVMRKGTRQSDGTRQPDGTLQWSPTEDLMKATKEGYRTMNPCPVFERNSKSLFLFFICLEKGVPEDDLKPGQSLLCYVTSSDCGETWSDPTDLTAIIKQKFTNCRTFAVGPGHGIQLSSELSSGLLVPAYVKVVEGGPSRESSCCWCTGSESGESSYSVVIRSQDPHNPDTWHVGERIAMKSGECQLAEVCDREGRRQVYMNARSAEEFRVEALSDDSGINFTLLSELTLKESPNGCQGSVLAFPARELPAGVGEGGQERSQETALLFSHPTAGEGYNRENLGLYVSTSLQDKPPWGKPSVILPGISGYSDLTHCEQEGHFACLMERGGGERLQIVFREFDLHSPKCKDCIRYHHHLYT